MNSNDGHNNIDQDLTNGGQDLGPSTKGKPPEDIAIEQGTKERKMGVQ